MKALTIVKELVDKVKSAAISILMIIVSFAVNSVEAYELSFNTETNASKSVVHKIPISHCLDGIVGRGDVIEMATSLPDKLKLKDINGLGEASLHFLNGRLVRFQRDGDDSAKEKDISYLTDSPDSSVQLPDLWRKMPDDVHTGWRYWDKSSRLRLWFFNPNGAGTLFAEISLLLFAIATLFIKNNLARVVFCCGAVISTILLLMTGSRGSLVALAAGIAVIALVRMAFNRSSVKKSTIALLIGIVISAFAVLVFSSDRFGKNLLSLDSGNVQRLRVWRAAPMMFAAAPNGWGENCGRAYCEWFQDENDSRVLYYLVNTHLTWMVGKGWLFSFFYIFGWTIFFAMLLSNFQSRWNTVAFAMWTLFFIANWFSTLGQFVSLWVVPSLCTFPVVAGVVGNYKMLKKRYVIAGLVSPLISIGIVCGVIALGKTDLAKMPVPIRNDGNAVYVGTGKPAAYVVPDMWVLCRYNFGGMGRDIRAWCKDHARGGAVVIVDSIDKLPAEMSRLVLVGRSCRQYMTRMKKAAKSKSGLKGFPRAKQMVFVSPNLTIATIPEKLARMLHLQVYTGEFLAEVTGDLAMKGTWVHIVSGCELYLPNWMKFVMEGAKL